MIRNFACCTCGIQNGKKLDLELLFNQIGGIFKPGEAAQEENCSFQAALSAKDRKTNSENRGAAVQDRNSVLICWSCIDELFGTPEIQKALEYGDATDARGDTQNVPTMEGKVSELIMSTRTVLRIRMVMSVLQLNQMKK